ncbi:MAG: transcription elongation factor GreA [Alphaproteobacteria bacterium]|nr:transcription elongation factor GreA [Alphaproteobacteria bacterium]
MQRAPMTPAGHLSLENELRQLKGVERHNVIKAISEAREHGDLSENAEYHAAREKQSFIEGRVKIIEDLLSRSQVIDPTQFSGTKIRFGATVIIADEDTDEESKYKIVGQHEANIKKGLISLTSPIGRSLIGKEIEDSIEVSTPSGVKTYEVVDVKYI